MFDAHPQIGDARGYLKRAFPTGIELESCWLSADTVLNVNASVEEALEAGRWVHVTPLLPSPLSRADVALVLKRCIERKLPAHSATASAAEPAAPTKPASKSKGKANEKEKETVAAPLKVCFARFCGHVCACAVTSIELLCWLLVVVRCRVWRLRRCMQ
jgi:hypothetical protein